jgi:FRG domain
MTFTDIEELRSYIDSLPPPPKGYVRIFRGQNRKYVDPTGKHLLLASAHRPGKSYPERYAWNIYVNSLAQSLEFDEARKLSCREEATRYLEENKARSIGTWTFWLNALSQHYGPGTHFLDVTRSLDIALWFASHKIKGGLQMMGLNGQPGTDEYDVRTENECISYESNDQDGWLYVLDVRESDSELVNEHGTLVDIEKTASPIFQRATRLKIQQACLLYCDPKEEEGNCYRFKACEPICVTRTMTRPSGFIVLRVTDLFPSPDRDEWYRRLINVPSVIKKYSGANAVTMKSALPVELYLDMQDPESELLSSIAKHLITVRPLLAYPKLSLTDAGMQHATQFEETTLILMESTFWSITPSVESGDWHEELLWKNIGGQAASASGFSIDLDKKCLQNLFIEFSPLDIPNWYEIEQGAENIFTKTIWIRFFGDFALVIQGLQCFNPYEMLYKQYAVAFIEADRSLYLVQNDQLFKVSEQGRLCKPLYLTLMLMSDLLPDLKLDPLSFGQIRYEGILKTTLIAASEGRAYLKRLDYIDFRKPYHSPCYKANGQPYIGPRSDLNTPSVACSLPGPKPFAQYSIAEMWDAMQKANR